VDIAYLPVPGAGRTRQELSSKRHQAHGESTARADRQHFLRQAVYRYISKEQLVQAVAECSELAQPSDYNSLAYAARSFPHIRQFTPRFLDVIHFDSDQKPASLLAAVAFMRQFNAEGRRKLVDAPVDFIPWRWRKHVVSKGQVINRALHEMCLSECLIQAVDNGQIWVESSREHISFRRDWIADEEWPAARRAFLAKYPQLADVSHYLAQMRQSLNERMSEVDRRWPELDLPELLTEVNGWTGFADHLTSLNPQVRQIPNLTARKLAAVMALGMNRVGEYGQRGGRDELRGIGLGRRLVHT